MRDNRTPHQTSTPIYITSLELLLAGPCLLSLLSSLVSLHHVCHHQGYDRLFRRQTAQAEPQCDYNPLRDVLQPLSAHSFHGQEDPRPDLSVGSDLHG